MCFSFQPLPPASAALQNGAGQEFSLTADGGVISLSGHDSAFVDDQRITAAGIAFAATGQDANFHRMLRISAQPGAFALSGQDAEADVPASRLDAGQALFSISGHAVFLAAARQIPPAAAPIAVTGQDVNFVVATGSAPSGAALNFSLSISL